VKAAPKSRIEFLTPREAAAKLRINRQIIYTAIEKGDLRALKKGRDLWIRPHDLALFGEIKQSRPSAVRRLPQPDSVGWRLREIRLNAHNPKTGEPYTQQELGELLGASQNSIKNWELCLRRVPLEILEKYSKLGITSVGRILTGKP
jgi:excisionase family DNA binding protein